jgi:hypothetical protein
LLDDESKQGKIMSKLNREAIQQWVDEIDANEGLCLLHEQWQAEDFEREQQFYLWWNGCGLP